MNKSLPTKANSVPMITHVPRIPIVTEDCLSSGADISFRCDDDKDVLATVRFSFIWVIFCWRSSVEMLDVVGQVQRHWEVTCSEVLANVEIPIVVGVSDKQGICPVSATDVKFVVLLIRTEIFFKKTRKKTH